jgi:hypothetical protein
VDLRLTGVGFMNRFRNWKMIAPGLVERVLRACVPAPLLEAKARTGTGQEIKK